MWCRNCFNGQRVALFVLVLVFLASGVDSSRKHSRRRRDGPQPVPIHYDFRVNFIADVGVITAITPIAANYTPNIVFVNAIRIANRQLAANEQLSEHPDDWTYQIQYTNGAEYGGPASDTQNVFRLSRTQSIFFV